MSDNDGAEETPGEDADLAATADLPSRVGEHDEELAAAVEDLVAEVGDLRDRVEDLEADLDDREAEVEDLESRLKRKQADFQNYKKRRKRKEAEIRDRATEDLVDRLLDVRDDLLRALEDDHDDVEGLREGVRMTLKEFDRVLDAENVEEIAPDPGTAVDPNRHEVMMRVESDRPADTVVEVYEPGYEMADKVLRAAKVTVSEGPAEDSDEVVEQGDGADESGNRDEEEAGGQAADDDPAAGTAFDDGT